MIVHSERGRKVAGEVYAASQTSGIHEQTEMPEDMPLAGVAESSMEHLLFIDSQTRYLFDPRSIHETPTTN